MQEPQLSGVQRMVAARIIGVLARLADTVGADVTQEQAVAELHAITRDPVPLGYALGVCLHQAEVESTDNQPTIGLLRSAGADEDVAAAKLAWLRWRTDMESPHNWMRRRHQDSR